MFRNPGTLRVARACRRILWDQAEEDFRANAHARSAKTFEEKDERGEITDAEAVGVAGEVAFAEEKIDRQPFAFRDSRAQSVGVAKEKEEFTNSFSGSFPERVGQEEKAQEFSDTNSVGNAEPFREPEWYAGGKSERDSVARRLAVAEKKGSACDDFGQRD